MDPLERRLRGAFEAAHEAARTDLGFGMPVLLRMAAESGPAEAARRILRNPTEIYTKLFLHHRLDLSVEAIVLRAAFRPLFTEDELRSASDRLREANFAVPEDDETAEMEAWAKLARKGRDRWDAENPY